MKEVRWHGSSRSDLEPFPNDARREAGYQLFQVQIGENPTDWRSMPSIGIGVREIRIRQASGAYRIIYLTTIGDVVHVLHAFQKKTQATAKRDVDALPKHGLDRSGDGNDTISIPRPLLRGRSRRAGNASQIAFRHQQMVEQVRIDP